MGRGVFRFACCCLTGVYVNSIKRAKANASYRKFVSMMLHSFLTTRNAAMYFSARSLLIAFAHGNAYHCVRRDRAGHIVLSFKRLLTYHAFTDDVVLWQVDRIREFVALTPHIHPITQ